MSTLNGLRGAGRRGGGFALALATVLSSFAAGTAVAQRVGASGYSVASGSGADVLLVPCFTTTSLISVHNLSASAVTLKITYMDLNGVDRTPAQNTYAVAGGATVRWAPLVNDSIAEGAETAVPDMTGSFSEGSAVITTESGATPLSGVLELYLSDGASSAYRLVRQNEAAPSLVVPYFSSSAFIAVQNVSTLSQTIALKYRDFAGADRSPSENTFALAPGAAVRWGPLINDSSQEGTEGNAVPDMTGGLSEGSVVISTAGTLAGRVELDQGAAFRGYTLGAGVDAKATNQLCIPYFRTGAYLALRNLGASAASLNVSYSDLAGSLLSSINHQLNAGGVVRDAPFASGLQGTEATAIISSDQPLAGQLELYDGGVASAYRLSASNDWATSLSVPYFRTGSFIVVTNRSFTQATLAIHYADLSGQDRTPVENGLTLAAGATVRWAPLVNDPVNEGAGSAVPDMTGGLSEGSAFITSNGLLAGQVELGAGVAPRKYPPADINQDGTVNAVDVQLVINAALGITVAFNADVNNDGPVNAVDVQRVINAALGL